MGSEQEAISSYFQRGHLPHLPCKEVHIRPQLPLQEVNENTSEGPIFDQELVFYLLEVCYPISYFVLKTISTNKECLEVQNINAHTSIPILGRTMDIKDKSQLE